MVKYFCPTNDVFRFHLAEGTLDHVYLYLWFFFLFQIKEGGVEQPS